MKQTVTCFLAKIHVDLVCWLISKRDLHMLTIKGFLLILFCPPGWRIIGGLFLFSFFLLPPFTINNIALIPKVVQDSAIISNTQCSPIIVRILQSHKMWFMVLKIFIKSTLIEIITHLLNYKAQISFISAEKCFIRKISFKVI